MQWVTRDEFLQLLKLSGSAFDQAQHSGHVALAFGASIPATRGRYVDLDLVAMAINLGLAPSIGRENSTAIVAECFPHWASAVGHAEADRTQDFIMAVGLVGWNPVKKIAKLFLVTHGTLDQIIQDFRVQKDLVGFFSVNISDIIRRLRERARVAGIDLSRPFFLPSNDPEFSQILMQAKREWSARNARLRRVKKKLAAAKEHRRRQDITMVSRVQNVNYLAMQGVQ